ncbi:nucleotidyltransferase family protein [Mixta calida]|uniref:nucleotidyltransferase family protein n=1 Tax=Mixta calida TaxID=665913 RepID=UPI0028A15763|nr:NTP transferase domain-containing protein [Mixta calida]
MSEEIKQCLLLAAGFSSRMGRWKMMQPWENATVLDCALNNALSFCERVILVTGYRGEALRQRYAGRSDITLCHNPNYARGMFSSIRCGARHLLPGAFFVVPGDMVLLTEAIYAALWRQRARRLCLVPEYNGGYGHPVLLPDKMRRSILAAEEEDNLKRLILLHGRQAVRVDSQAIHCDLDTPAQYEQLKRATADHTF